MASGSSLPWSNCRLTLREEEGHEEGPGGVVARLYYTAASHPAVRQPLSCLDAR